MTKVAALLLAYAGMVNARSEPKMAQLDSTSCSFQSSCICSARSLAGSYQSVACYPKPTWPLFFDAANAVDVSELYVVGNFTTIPKNAFEGLRKVRSLEIQRAQYSGSEGMVVDPQAFIPNLPYTLEQLEFFDSNLYGIPPAVKVLSNLNFLQIQRSNIPHIQDYTFQAEDQTVYSSPRLVTLLLSRNGLQTIGPRAFAGQEASLTTLDLSWNSITTLPAAALAPLGSLQQLTLDQNQLTNLPTAPFSSLTRLITLSLAGNQLKVLPNDFFTGLGGSLRWLSLEGNSLERLPNSLFLLRAAQTLRVGSNRIQHLAANTFRNMALLTQLHLDYNDLITMDAGVFHGLTLLSNLQLTNCRMGAVNLNFLAHSFVERLVLTENPELRTIDLSSADAVNLPSSLTLLNFSSNPKLRTISPAIEELMANTTSLVLDLSGTRLECSCSARWLLELPESRLRLQGASCIDNTDTLTGLRALDCRPLGNYASRAIPGLLSLLLVMILRM